MQAWRCWQEIENSKKHENSFIIKSNESFAEHKVKNEIDQLLSKYKHVNNIHEHRKH